MANETNEEQLRFRLETEGIEAKALVRILQDTHLTFREIGKANETPDIELKIYPFKHGSFEFSTAVVSTLNVTAAAVNIGVAALTVFREILSYKKAKLEYHKFVHASIFEDRTKDVVKPEEPPVLQKNPTINIYMNGMLKTIADNSQGFSLSVSSSEDNISIHLTNTEIRKVLAIEKSHQPEVSRQTIEIPNTSLFLKAISEKPYGKWEFIYEGNRIRAEVPVGLKKGAKVKNYSPGAIFYVTLSVRQKFNNTVLAWENESYRITEVHKIEPSLLS